MIWNDTSPDPGNTRGRILQAAAQLFAEKGYAGATTRAIAEAAGVNEITLFRHFGTKENLAQTIMDQFGGLAIAGNLEEKLSGDTLEDLTQIGHALLDIMTARSAAIRMAICEAGNFPEFREIVAENPRQLRRMLGRYFERQMQTGAIRPGHPEMLAQAFLGMFFAYTVLENFLLDSVDPGLTPEEVVAQFVSLFVRGACRAEE